MYKKSAEHWRRPCCSLVFRYAVCLSSALLVFELPRNGGPLKTSYTISLVAYLLGTDDGERPYMNRSVGDTLVVSQASPSAGPWRTAGHQPLVKETRLVLAQLSVFFMPLSCEWRKHNTSTDLFLLHYNVQEAVKLQIRLPCSLRCTFAYADRVMHGDVRCTISHCQDLLLPTPPIRQATTTWLMYKLGPHGYIYFGLY